MIVVVCTATKKLKFHYHGIDADLVGSHLLQVGGAMALKIHGYDDKTIKTFSRWTILNFLKYIHNQITHLSKYVSGKMSIALPFLNISAIEGLHA